MARTRIIIGTVNKTTTHLLYHGPSGSDAEAAMKANTTCQSFEIFEGPGRRKNNPNYKAGDEAVAEVKAEAVNEVKEVKTEPAPASETLHLSGPEAPESPATEETAPKAKSNKK